jgi:hypothetical protein
VSARFAFVEARVNPTPHPVLILSPSFPSAHEFSPEASLIFLLHLHFAQWFDGVIRTTSFLNFSPKIIANGDELLGQFLGSRVRINNPVAASLFSA